MTQNPAKNARLSAYLATKEGQETLAALAAHGEATRQAARALQSGSGEEALRLLAQVLTPEQLAQVQRELLGR